MSESIDSIKRLMKKIDSLRARLKKSDESSRDGGSLNYLLLESAARRDAVLQCSLDCIVTIDSEGLILEFNPAAEDTFGYKRDEVLGKGMANLIVPPSLRAAHEQGLKHYLVSGEGPVLNRRIEITAARSNGQEFPVELAITPFRIGSKTAFTAFIRDITKRKRAEETLRATERQL